MDHGDPIGDAADEGFWDPDLDDEPWNRQQPSAPPSTPDASDEVQGARRRGRRYADDPDPEADAGTDGDRPFVHRDPSDTTRMIAWGVLGLAALVIIGFTFFRGSDSPDDTTDTTVATDTASQVYGALITELAGDVDSFREQAALINERWESDEADYQETLAALEQLSSDMSSVAGRMRLAEAPADLSQENHTRLVTSAGTLENSASGMVDGLKAPDTGEARRTALARFAAAAAEFQAVADTLLQVIDLTATPQA